MRVRREGHLLQLTWMPSFFPVNCYLLEEENGLTLIDAAMPFSAKGIIRTAEKLGKAVTAIILTHAHDDHVGALDAIAKHYPDAKVYISERDADLLRGDRSLRPDEPQMPIKGGVPKNIVTKPDVLLKEGDTIGSLKAIRTPGHTPGSMSFIDQRSGSVIAGDALQMFRKFVVAGTLVPLFPFPALATWNKEIALQSARKLQALKPSLLAAGHGDWVKNPDSKLQEAIERSERP